MVFRLFRPMFGCLKQNRYIRNVFAMKLNFGPISVAIRWCVRHLNAIFVALARDCTLNVLECVVWRNKSEVAVLMAFR